MHTLDELKAAPSCAVGEVEVVTARMLHGASVEVTGPHDDTGGTVSITLYCRRDPRPVAKPDIYGHIGLTPALLRFCAELPEKPEIVRVSGKPDVVPLELHDIDDVGGSLAISVRPDGAVAVTAYGPAGNEVTAARLDTRAEWHLLQWLLNRNGLRAGIVPSAVTAGGTCETCVHGHDLGPVSGAMVVCGPQHRAHDPRHTCSGYRRITKLELDERSAAKHGA